MIDSSASIARLKRRIDRLARPLHAPSAGLFSLGDAPLDARLGGGLARAGLHEAVAMEPGDYPSACAFALMLALRASDDAGRILIVSTDRQDRQNGLLYAPGLIDLGLEPERLVSIHAPDEKEALKAAADIVSVFGVGAAIIDIGDAKKLDLTVSRRVLLAASQAGVTGIILRNGAGGFASAASTRWSIAPAPSLPLPGNAPGHPMLRLDLVRHRGGIAPFQTVMEWNREQKAFAAPSLLRDFPAPAEHGQMAA